MTTASHRYHQAVAIQAALDDLINDDERAAYELLLEHLDDYVSDLEIDVTREG